jgi:hypothetical protein
MADKRSLYILNQLEKHKGLMMPMENPFKKIQTANSVMKAYYITKKVFIVLVFKSTIIRLIKDINGLETFIEIVLLLVGLLILRILKPLLS